MTASYTAAEAKAVVRESWVSRRAWLLILLFALGFSAWSLFTMARSLGAPVWLAVGASAVFDGAAIVLGDQSHRARLEGDSALQERIVVVVLVGCSAWLNWQHAAKVGWGAFGLLPAAAPVVAEVLFELRTKFAHRAHLRAAGLIAPRLIPLGRWSWMVYPGRSWVVVKAQISGRLDAIEGAARAGDLLLSGGWISVEQRTAPGASDVDVPEPQALPVSRLALPAPVAASTVELAGQLFRLTPVAESATVPAPSQGPSEAPESGAGQALDIEPAFSDKAMSGPSHDQVNASLPESQNDGSEGSAVAARVAAAHSGPARRANQVTARVGVDREEAERVYRESVASGAPLSSRDLAAATGVSQTTASRIIRALKG